MKSNPRVTKVAAYVILIVAMLCGVCAGRVLTLGAIDVTVCGVRFRCGHPNIALFGALLCTFVFYAILHKCSWRACIRRVCDVCARHDKALPWLLAFAAFMLLSRIKLMQHITFHTGAYDLAMYDTAVRNTLRGNFLFAAQLGRNFFSEHFSPILLLACPLYAVFDSPVTLLLTESLGVALGLVFVYKIARFYELSPLTACLTSVIFLNYKFLAHGVMFDFHPEMWEPTFLLACIYFMLRGRRIPYFAFLFLALSCKEDVAIYTLMSGAYMMLFKEKRKLGAVTCAISLAWAAASWKFIIPGAMPHEAAVSHFVEARWGHLGNDYASVVVSLVKRPLYVLSGVFSKAPVMMVALLLFLPALGGEILLIALPGIVLNTTTTYDMQVLLKVHYAAPIIPFVMWATLLGIARAKRMAAHFSHEHAERMTTVAVSVWASVAILTFGAYYKFYGITPHENACHAVMRQLPEGATVCAGTGFVPHLTRTHDPILFPAEPNRAMRYQDCRYLLLDRNGNPWPLNREELNRTIDKILAYPESYRVVASQHDVYLFENMRASIPATLTENNAETQ